METAMLGPILAICISVWFLSLIFVMGATFFSSNYKENVLQGIVLKHEQDEREALVAGRASKKSILVTLAASLLLLIATTAQLNQSQVPSQSSLTIGHFRLSDDTETKSIASDGYQITHHELPMSKMSLVLLLILIQLASFHTMNFFELRKLD